MYYITKIVVYYIIRIVFDQLLFRFALVWPCDCQNILIHGNYAKFGHRNINKISILLEKGYCCKLLLHWNSTLAAFGIIKPMMYKANRSNYIYQIHVAQTHFGCQILSLILFLKYFN